MLGTCGEAQDRAGSGFGGEPDENGGADGVGDLNHSRNGATDPRFTLVACGQLQCR